MCINFNYDYQMVKVKNKVNGNGNGLLLFFIKVNKICYLIRYKIRSEAEKRFKLM